MVLWLSYLQNGIFILYTDLHSDTWLIHWNMFDTLKHTSGYVLELYIIIINNLLSYTHMYISR